MAPKGRGGSSGGGSSSGGSSYSIGSCPGFLSGNTEGVNSSLAYYVAYVLFLLFTAAILLSLCCVRKKRSRLTGILFILMLIVQLMYAILFIALHSKSN